jgi:murein DD-endopeptidase MepM/ murein hydrolase activator NlpD
MNEMENVTIIEKFLGYGKISDYWNDLEQTISIQKEFHTELDELLDLHSQLTEREAAKNAEKDELASQKVLLAAKTEAIEETKEEKETLLVKTKNEESTYQKLLNQKIKEREAFEAELLEIESKLNYLIDPGSYPEPSRGIIDWPLESIYITQYFGGTQFAKTNPGVYGRPFHPGVDFGASIGTKIMSVSRGVVKGTGNTDAYPGCNAWGKWVVVEHPNGLTSLYAHLSSILVSPGDQVTTGQTIALSGNTGYSTGPHLHFTLYASQGVKIGRYSEFKGGTGCSATAATSPFADLDAYLDPMDYFPKL